MRFLDLIPTLALIGAAQAGCYSGGNKWVDKSAAYTAASAACKTLLAGAFGPTGSYNGDKSACVNEGERMEFHVWHTVAGNADLSIADCYSGLYSEIHGCDHGGDSTKGIWRFRSDPNAGAC